MKREDYSITALQDFCRNASIPHTLKSDNSRAQICNSWIYFERKMCMHGIYAEPHSPWQKMTKHTIHDLQIIVCRCMHKFHMPLNQCHWCLNWCKYAHNHLAIAKLGWRTPHECLFVNTPESMFSSF